MIKHPLEHAPHRALLPPDLAPHWLLIPEIAAIGSRDTAGVLGGVCPSRRALHGAGLVNDPFPRDVALFASHLEQAVDSLHFGCRHRGDQAGGEQLVADAASGGWLGGLSLGVPRL